MEQINVDLIPGKVLQVCHSSQYDVGRTIRVNLFEGGQVFTFDGTQSAQLKVRKTDGNVVTAALTAASGTSYVEIETTQQMTACAGLNMCDIVIIDSSNSISTANFFLNVEQDPLDGGINSASEIHDLQAQVNAAVASSDYGKELDAVDPAYSTTFTLKKNIDGNGNISTNSYTALSGKIYVSPGDVVVRTLQAKDSSNISLIFYVSQFTAADGFIRRTALNFGESIVVGSTTDYIYISFGRASSSGVQITQDDVDNYFQAKIYRKAVSLREYESEGFISRGTMQSLGYTSPNQCSLSGVYTFNSSYVASMTNLPDGWSGGGCIITYNNKGTIWQRLFMNSQSFTRYSLSGSWFNDASGAVCVTYLNEAGDDNSTEQVLVDIKITRSMKRVRFALGHCVNNSINADVWRLMYIATLNSSGTETKITRRGEFECAVHLLNRPDFSGGVVHGDEVDDSITFFTDGAPANVNAVGGLYERFVVVRNSTLYDPDDNTTPIAKHGVEYIFDSNGLKVKQSLKWLVAESLTNCYLAMLPIKKAYSGYRYDDTSFEVKQNTLSSYSFSIPNAKSVTEYGGNSKTTMSIEEYPTGLTGGDKATITDNSGIDYNKVYFVVCTSGTSAVDELWKTTTNYHVE